MKKLYLNINNLKANNNKKKQQNKQLKFIKKRTF